MNLFLELWRLLDTRQRRGFVLAQALALVMTAFTLAGVAAVVPFFAVFADRQLISRNPLLYWLYQRLGFTTQQDFVVALGLGPLVVVLLGNAINMVGSLALNIEWGIASTSHCSMNTCTAVGHGAGVRKE